MQERDTITVSGERSKETGELLWIVLHTRTFLGKAALAAYTAHNTARPKTTWFGG